MEKHITYAEDDRGCVTDAPLAYIHPASARSIETILSAPVETGDGRSDFMWVRLANGDLILGVFPQGETYQALEQDAAWPG